ncbi:MAG: NAD(P)-dependent alcohol dehydrogenase, partial [Ilumatobacter sp.]
VRNRTENMMNTDTQPAENLETQSHPDPRASRVAAVQRRYGGAEQVRLERVGIPAPGPRQVVVQVAASAIDRGVIHLMTGHPLLIRVLGFGLLRPKQQVLGSDVSGRVVAVGDRVGRFRVGDEVMGIDTGAFAEYAVADADKLVMRPAEVSIDDAAVSTISGITALQALTAVGRVNPGQRVLVIGASGGVGSFAVQIATALGAQVTGVAGATNLDTVRALGAVHAVDYRETPIDEIGSTFDLVIDVGGRNPIRRIRRVLARSGTLVIVGGENGGRLTGGIGRNLRAAALSIFVSQRLTAFISKETLEYIEPLAAMLADGSVRPHIGARTDLAGVAAAIEDVDRGGVAGKTVVAIGGAS